MVGREVQQKEIADETGITQSTLSRYINGYLASLKLDVEYRLCQFFSAKLGRRIGRDELFSFELDEAS